MLQIGPIKLKNRLALAPMAGVTDSVFRDICSQHGAGYVVSEMVSADTTLHGTEKTRTRILKTRSASPHAVQIVGSDPDKLAAAARYNVSQGADIIDINMGCPAKKVCNKLAGSALLEDEKLVERILQAVVKSVTVPVTLKIRTGPDRERRNGVAIAKIAEDCGIQMLAVHGRTRADRFKGEAEFDTIAAIKQSVRLPVLANGDIKTPEQALDVLARTGADGLMIGRAAQGNPWIFAQINAYLINAYLINAYEINACMDGSKAQRDVELTDAPDVSIENVHAVLSDHVRRLHELYGEYRGLRIARKHISWYCKSHRGSASFREQINQVTSADDQLRMIDGYFEKAMLENEKIKPNLKKSCAQTRLSENGTPNTLPVTDPKNSGQVAA